MFVECQKNIKPTKPNKKTSVESFGTYRKPKLGMIETETLKNIQFALKASNEAFVHCFGLPGSGKTELMCQLEANFAKKEKPAFVWDIDLRKSNNLKQELMDFVKDLVNNNFISESEMQSIEKDLDNKRAGKLVNALFESRASILIAITHLEQNDNLLRDVIRSLHDKSINQTSSSKFHIYITSRIVSPLFSEDEWQVLSEGKKCFKCFREQIRGFNENEAVAYLLKKKNVDFAEEAAVSEIFRKYSGLPLSMQVVKSYCDKYDPSYVSYLEKLKNLEQNKLLPIEKKLLTKQYEGNHPFYSIVYPFTNKESNDEEDASNNWKYLACISHLFVKKIPKMIWKPFYTKIRANISKELANRKVIDLVESLVNYCCCIRNKNDDLCFETVAATAFAFTRREQVEDKFNSVKEAIDILTSLFDSKKSEGKMILSIFQKHLESLKSVAENDDSIASADKEKLTQCIKL